MTGKTSKIVDVAEAKTEFRAIPLVELHESKLNLRKHFDETKLAELADSIRGCGVRSPILVRPIAEGFEIGAGHRRFRAAKLAGLLEIPAIVRPMDDGAFLELLTFENLEREDIHPLEEAEGYWALMKRAGYTVDRIAERLGRSRKYVYDRVKLLELTKEAKALFQAGRITAGHAILLARLKKDEQARALKAGVFQEERLLWDPVDGDREEDAQKHVSVRELEAWINENVRFDAKSKDLPDLFPETYEAISESDKVIPITYEHYVSPEAREGRTWGPRSWKRADGKHKSRMCDFATTGLVAVGTRRGEAFRICVAKDKCKMHWGKEQAESRKRKAGGKRNDQAAVHDRWEKQRAKYKADAAHWDKALPTILDAVAAGVKKASTKISGPICALLLKDVHERSRLEKRVPVGKSAEDFLRFLAFALLAEALTFGHMSRNQNWWQSARSVGADVVKILAATPRDEPAEQLSTTPATKKKQRKAAH